MPGDPQDVTYNGLNFIIKVNVPENKRKTFASHGLYPLEVVMHF